MAIQFQKAVRVALLSVFVAFGLSACANIDGPTAFIGSNNSGEDDGRPYPAFKLSHDSKPDFGTLNERREIAKGLVGDSQKSLYTAEQLRGDLSAEPPNFSSDQGAELAPELVPQQESSLELDDSIALKVNANMAIEAVSIEADMVLETDEKEDELRLARQEAIYKTKIAESADEFQEPERQLAFEESSAPPLPVHLIGTARSTPAIQDWGATQIGISYMANAITPITPITHREGDLVLARINGAGFVLAASRLDPKAETRVASLDPPPGTKLDERWLRSRVYNRYDSSLLSASYAQLGD